MSAPRVVLVVDDSAEDRALLLRRFREVGDSYTLLEADTGAAGLERCRTDRPDCVLLDFNLPDMEGTDLLAELAADQEWGPLLPVVMLTGQEDPQTASRALQEGAQDYLVKGTTTASGLARAVENAIEKFNIRRELEERRATLELRNRELEMVRDELQSKLLDLEDATQAKDQFLAVMSHEMRTPLNAILGYADLLEMGIGGELAKGQSRHVERIRVGGKHLLDLINDVLDLARADARKLELDLRPVALNTVLEEVTALLESQSQAKGIALRLEPCTSGVPLVHADLQRLRQVITNLVGNAIKFTEAGSVTVRCLPGDAVDEVRVEVIDTGIGISPDVLPLVFTEFYQAQGELTREQGGSGLGLAISQRLARLMGGDVVAQSTPGEGSTFSLLLRTAEQGSARRPDDVAGYGPRMDNLHAAPGPAPGLQEVTVVAFGDREAPLAALAQRVQPGVRLVWTTDADQLPELALQERAALVVLEIDSADGAAWRAAHALQNVRELAATAVLLLPAIPEAGAEEVQRELDLGWVSLVPKPFTAEQITRAVSGAARHTGELDEDPGSVDVLVVDDDPDSRRVAAGFLSAAKLRVREATDGNTALVSMRRRPPDVAVLDLMMPVLDGFGVLATMRADPLLSGIPVVVLSAKTLTEPERQFLARTAVRVLQKGEHRLADVAALVLRAAGGAG